MSNDKMMAGGIFAAGFAVIAGVMLFFGGSNGATATGAAAAADTGGPNLVIEVGGATQGQIVIDLFEDVAPNHVAQIVALAEAGAYDGVVFHRVIEGFMAQTGDVEFGRHGGDTRRAGMGGSDLPDLKAEFSKRPFERGTVGMARSQSPDSANSQFFIMFQPAPHLNEQYTAIGQVIEGMDVVDAIRKGEARLNGLVNAPDYMARVTVAR